MINKIINKYKSVGLFETVRWGIRGVKQKITPKKKRYEGNPMRTNNKDIIYKDGRNIFIFGAVPYYDIGGGQRSSQLAKVFNKIGFPVYYIHGFDSSESVVFHMEIPTIKHKHINKYTLNEFAKDIKKDDLVIFESPLNSFNEYLEYAYEVEAKIVYENIDNWETSLGYGVYNEDVLENMLLKSDLLTGTAVPLVDQLNEYIKKYKIKDKKEIIYLANAVDTDLFEPRLKYEIPEDLVQGEKTLLYYGSLWGSWFDWDLVFGIAKKFPEYQINLIGDYHGIPEIVKKSPKNIHYLGLKLQRELPAYLQHSDVTILPFKVDEIGEYVSPLKIFEYISMNKITLTTKLPDVAGYPNTYFGNTVKEWEKHLKNLKPLNEEKNMEFKTQNNWYERADRILDTLYKEEAKKIDKEFYSKISVVLLNYNNDKVIFNSINSLIKYNRRYNYEIIVVDNQSDDGSYEKLKKYGDKITLLRNTKNGCSSGRNLGIASVKRKYILFLDSDQDALTHYWLDSFIKLYEKTENIGAIGWSAGWFDKAGYAGEYVDTYPYRYMPSNVIGRKDIGYLGTGGFLVNKKTLVEIDGFDEFYDPTCYEDTDLSLLIRNAGYELVYSTHLGIFHLPHQTTESGSENHKRLMKEKGDYFVNKWLNKNKRLLDYKK